MQDSDRSAHGLGWEHARRGKLADENPFRDGSDKFYWWDEGWREYHKQPAEYETTLRSRKGVS